MNEVSLSAIQFVGDTAFLENGNSTYHMVEKTTRNQTR
jgi:hypothetical protein